MTAAGGCSLSNAAAGVESGGVVGAFAGGRVGGTRSQPDAAGWVFQWPAGLTLWRLSLALRLEYGQCLK